MNNGVSMSLTGSAPRFYSLKERKGLSNWLSAICSEGNLPSDETATKLTYLASGASESDAENQ